MTSQERLSLIKRNKDVGQNIAGKYVCLLPCELKHSEFITQLRNQKKSRFYLNQSIESTIENQNIWFHKYYQSDDDIYWCIQNNYGILIGVIRLYNIIHDGSCCNQGSFIISDEYAMKEPFALEAIILSIDYAYNDLHINKIINDIRVENKKMISICKRVGFKFTNTIVNDGVEFNIYELTRSNYKRCELLQILDLWKNRD